MKTLKLSAFLFAAALAVSCSTKPKGDEAAVTDAQAASITVGTELKIADSSVVTWVGAKLTGQHTGTINIKSGALTVADGSLTGGKIVFDLNTVSVEDLKADKESFDKLVGHLKSADFFDTSTFPEATFEITKVEAYVADAANPSVLANPTHTVTGNLTLRGTTKGISFPAIVHVMGEKVHTEAKFNIDRTQWGVSYGDEAKAVDKAKDFYINNIVNVGFNLTAGK